MAVIWRQATTLFAWRIEQSLAKQASPQSPRIVLLQSQSTHARPPRRAPAREVPARAPVDRVCQCGAGNPPIVPLPSTSNLASRWAPLATAFLNTVDLSSLLKLFGDVSASLGFPRFAISRVSRRHAGNGRAMAVETLCARYPDHWVAHYAQRDYGPVDPVHRMAFARATPYRWADIRGLNRIEQRVLGEARDAGLTNGVSIPLREANGDILLVNLASPSPEIRTEVHLRLASLIGALFHQELHRLMKPRRPEPSLQLSAPARVPCLGRTG